MTSCSTSSPSSKLRQREMASQLLKGFLSSSFSILILGERGTGKTRIIRDLHLKKIVSANCASFADDSKAESELFGYVAGAFTGANPKGQKGLIQQAERGVLFLDEVHSLSKIVQAKLMTALQTNQNNEMFIRPLGATESVAVKDVHLLFASNRSISDLRTLLLPDFYDRIVQHVIELPSLHDTIDDVDSDWSTVWQELKFKEKCPISSALINWLKKLPLTGNYRDLQKIAMNYHAYQIFDEETRRQLQGLGIRSAFDFAKEQYKKYGSAESDFNPLFCKGKTANELEREYHYRLQNWATEAYRTRAEAAQHLQVTEKTLNNWKNRK